MAMLHSEQQPDVLDGGFAMNLGKKGVNSKSVEIVSGNEYSFC